MRATIVDLLPEAVPAVEELGADYTPEERTHAPTSVPTAYEMVMSGLFEGFVKPR